MPRIARLIIANKPAIGAIERGKKADIEAASTHATPKIFAFQVIVRMLFRTCISFKPMLASPFSSSKYHQNANLKNTKNNYKVPFLFRADLVIKSDKLELIINPGLLLKSFLEPGNHPFYNCFSVICAGGHDDL